MEKNITIIFRKYIVSLIIFFSLFSCEKRQIDNIDYLKVCFIGNRDKSYPCVKFSSINQSNDDAFIYNEKLDKETLMNLGEMYLNDTPLYSFLGEKFIEIEISSDNHTEHILLNKKDAILFLSEILSHINEQSNSYFYINSMKNILQKK
jgi:hypothetical protein